MQGLIVYFPLKFPAEFLFVVVTIQHPCRRGDHSPSALEKR